MELHIGIGTVGLRLLLTAVAAGLLGLDRSEHGHGAGLRTTLLVGLAASAAMLQANLLLATTGRPGNSFIMMDLMRNPLGILTGVGFIGAGAIVRRGNRTQGVTTAATLWFVTVMGLCFGGGQLALGATAFALGALVLWPARWIERHLPTIQRGVLFLKFKPGVGHELATLRELLQRAGIGILSLSVHYANDGQLPVSCRLQLKGVFKTSDLPPAIERLAHDPSVAELRWKT